MIAFSNRDIFAGSNDFLNARQLRLLVFVLCPGSMSFTECAVAASHEGATRLRLKRSYAPSSCGIYDGVATLKTMRHVCI